MRSDKVFQKNVNLLGKLKIKTCAFYRQDEENDLFIEIDDNDDE
jgi:hypothetical protein